MIGLVLPCVLSNSVQAAATFVKHAGKISPQNIEANQEVELTVSVGCDNGREGVQDDDSITDMRVYYTTDGTNPGVFRGQPNPSSQVIALKWHQNQEDRGCPTGSKAIWKGKIPGQPERTQVRYIIETWNRNDSSSKGRVWADSISYDGGNSTLLITSPNHRPTIFGYYVQNDYSQETWSPAWAKDAVIYHIFVDRFRDGDVSNNNSQTTPGDGCLARNAKEYCVFSEDKRNGGDLQGIIDALDYLSELGITALWLSPVFKSDKYHGYNVIDYQTVEPFFGDNQKLEELVNAAHARGIRIILDFVPNHTGDRHPNFRDAQKDCQKSPFFWFYIFKNCPNDYLSFFGVKNQPKLNLQYQPARDYILSNVLKWLSNDFNGDGRKLEPNSDGFRGIDGYRMDYAQGADPCNKPSCHSELFQTEQSFWRLYRAVVKRRYANSFTFAENTFDKDYQAYNEYAPELDGTLDFALSQALFEAFVGSGTPGSNLSGNNIDRLNEALLAHELNFAPGFIPVTFLSNHDQYRFYYKTGNNPRVTQMAAAIQFTLKGTPVIYYGEEIGITQDRDGVFEPTRKRMIWKADSKLPPESGWTGSLPEPSLRDFYTKLIQIRRNYPALRSGFYTSLWRSNDEDTLAYGRYLPNGNPNNPKDNSVIVALNLNSQSRSLSIPNQSGNGTSLNQDLRLSDGTILEDRLTGKTYSVQNGRVDLILEGQQVVILTKKRG